MKLGPYDLGPNADTQGIYTGDARELAEAIPDESVDLIFTDPVYDRIDDYEWLAETAARVLKPDSACLVFCGTGYKDKIMRSLSQHLNYHWDLIIYVTNNMRMTHEIYCKAVSCLWFDKGKRKPIYRIQDLRKFVISTNSTFHRWQKYIGPTRYWLGAFCDNDGIVFDPFAGSGTLPCACKQLSRRWLAFEIDPDTADVARERVRQTQPPLFVLEHEQMKFDTEFDTGD